MLKLELKLNKKLEKRVKNIINEFIENFNRIWGDKYNKQLFERLNCLKEIRYEYNDSKYKASSKDSYIVFFKKIEDGEEFKYILEHELFHFIQKPGSLFEKIPQKYESYLNKNIHIELLEEAFVQYFTVIINNKKPEYETTLSNNKKVKYWLNECYKNITWIAEGLEEKIGIENMMNMYMDDNFYLKMIDNYDMRYGENAFANIINEINYYSDI